MVLNYGNKLYFRLWTLEFCQLVKKIWHAKVNIACFQKPRFKKKSAVERFERIPVANVTALARNRYKNILILPHIFVAQTDSFRA